MKQNQKSNQKFNPKIIFLGSLLILMSVAFIFASGCVIDDSNYTPPSAPPDIVLTKAPSNEPIRGGYTYPTEPAPDDYIAPTIEQTTNN